MIYKVESLRISPQKQSHFLFPFSRLVVHRYASRLEEQKIPLHYIIEGLKIA